MESGAPAVGPDAPTGDSKMDKQDIATVDGSRPTSGPRVIQDEGRIGVFTSASPRCLDRGDVDLLHRHHRLEGTLCLTAASGKRIG
jgi:hypothetical protein